MSVIALNSRRHPEDFAHPLSLESKATGGKLAEGFETLSVLARWHEVGSNTALSSHENFSRHTQKLPTA